MPLTTLKSNTRLLITNHLDLKGFRAINSNDAINPTDLVTLRQLQANAQGLVVKAPARVGTTGAITLSGLQTIDGVTLAAGDRVLVKNQADPATNGIYVVASGAWARSDDADSSAEMAPNTFIFISEGTVQADTGWVLSTNGPITLGTTGLTFIQFSTAGTIEAGAGLLKTGNVFDIVSASTDRIVVNNDSIDLALVARTNTAGTAGISAIQSFTTDGYGRVTGAVTADIRTATTTARGLASFAAANFDVDANGGVTIKAGGISNASLANSSITVTAGTGMSGGGTVALGGTITLTNAGVTSAIGTANQVIVSNATGAVTFSLPQSIATTSTPTFGGLVVNGNVTGTGSWQAAAIGVGYGGTGLTTYVVGDLIQATGTGTLSRLAAVAAGNVLISGGVGAVSSWGKVALGTHTSGTLGVANGGTGSTTFTAGIVYANGTNAFATATASQILAAIGTVPIANGGTGGTTAPTAGQFLVATGATTFAPRSITAGTGISVSSDATTTTIAITSGVVQSGNLIFMEDMVGTIDGTNTAFTFAGAVTPIAGKLIVYVDGQAMRGGGNDYTITGGTVTFVTAPEAGSVVTATYLK